MLGRYQNGLGKSWDDKTKATKYKQMFEKHIEPSFGDIAIAKLEDSLIYELQSLKKADGLSDSTQ